MPGLGSVTKIHDDITQARSTLNNATAFMKQPPPWLVTEFGANCAQGIGNANGFPSAIHDMIDQSSYTISAINALAGEGEPQALSCTYVCVRVCVRTRAWKVARG